MKIETKCKDSDKKKSKKRKTNKQTNKGHTHMRLSRSWTAILLLGFFLLLLLLWSKIVRLRKLIQSILKLNFS